MNKLKICTLLLLTISVVFLGCKKDEVPSTCKLVLDIDGLKDLGPNYAYEGWIIVDGKAKTAGIFDVDSLEKLSENIFSIDINDLATATAYVLTIEPKPDNDPSASSVHILGGNFSGNKANISVNHGSAIGTDFKSAEGEYILATPTDGDDNANELSGVWWLNPSEGPGAGLNLPNLPTGWIYEGWIIVDGKPVSTGKFNSINGSDQSNHFSGSTAGPAFPGEDLLENAPGGLTFPYDLSGQIVGITVEPVPDNSTDPFFLLPLKQTIPDSAIAHNVYMMTNIANETNPTGTVRK